MFGITAIVHLSDVTRRTPSLFIQLAYNAIFQREKVQCLAVSFLLPEMLRLTRPSFQKLLRPILKPLPC